MVICSVSVAPIDVSFVNFKSFDELVVEESQTVWSLLKDCSDIVVDKYVEARISLWHSKF